MATLAPVCFPTFRLYYFVPFIIITFYQKSFNTCLWLSLFCGVIVDIFFSGDQLGMHAFVYVITTSILFNRKQNFFSDSLTTLPIMTFFYSVIVTVCKTIIFAGMNRSYFFNLAWFFSDLILMPIFDATYAFSFFILPFICFGKKRLKGTDYFISR